MIFLLLSVLCSTAIYAIFKLFSRFGIDTFQAIVFNYYIAAFLGFTLIKIPVDPAEIAAKPWFLNSVVVGVLFIGLFYLMATTSQKIGVSVAAIATKMSFVIPVVFFVVTDADESLDALKIAGVVFAVAGVYLSSAKDKKTVSTEAFDITLVLPVILFLGSGVLDVLIAFSEKNLFTAQTDELLFVPVPFFFAATIGSMLLLYKVLFRKTRLQIKNLSGGLVLGLANYGSIYFLIKALGSGVLERSGTLPVNNIAIVALSALIGKFIFEEKLNLKNKIGVILSLLAIVLILLSRKW